MNDTELLAAMLHALGETVSEHAIRHRNPSRDFEVAGFEGGDTVYSIDRLVEPVIIESMKNWPDKLKPVVVIAEGMGNGGEIRIGGSAEPPKYRVLIDPIDGTRGLMYDKRAAWFLAAAANDRGPDTRLSDSIVSVLYEIPTSKQYLVDSFVAMTGSPTVGYRRNIIADERWQIDFSPSTSRDLRDGFAQISNFFPGTKELASELMELIASQAKYQIDEGQALIFDDQYISTGGQFVQLMSGKDRFCCDLRPLFYQVIESRTGRRPIIGLECHPYDIAGLLAAKNSGVIITDGFGNEIDSPLDTNTSVHWCGYSNSTLQAEIEPIITEWLSRQLE